MKDKGVRHGHDTETYCNMKYCDQAWAKLANAMVKLGWTYSSRRAMKTALTGQLDLVHSLG